MDTLGQGKAIVSSPLDGRPFLVNAVAASLFSLRHWIFGKNNIAQQCATCSKRISPYRPNMEDAHHSSCDRSELTPHKLRWQERKEQISRAPAQRVGKSNPRSCSVPSTRRLVDAVRGSSSAITMGLPATAVKKLWCDLAALPCSQPKPSWREPCSSCWNAAPASDPSWNQRACPATVSSAAP